ncbi:tetratricopeptide repeat protein [Planococcus shixiaomingii]|uniref:tetratricopeptide repeat protein n=1 Tax=Planococcus shixiaomingii TaxID=3058393 RepID=UPI0026162E00|nr:tetratricopeptide repeat protein [Planococcus sp. N022]WKA53181.1 tetratricopeptide repeat protein [Planococcus sp. N022]
MRYMDMSLEELEDQDRLLHSRQEIDEATLYRKRIELYGAMRSHFRKTRKLNEEDQSILDDITERLAFNLIHFGTYIKMADKKESFLAISSLEKALQYAPKNPVAAYRLGFLFYRRSDFDNALKYFRMAISNQRLGKDKMLLNERQVIHAHTYLTNSALHIAKQTQDTLEELSGAEVEQLPGYEFSRLFESLNENDSYLRNHAFYRETKEGRTTCSKQDCEDFAFDPPQNTIVLYFGDSETSLNFNDKAVSLSKRPSDLLRFLLTSSSAASPASVADVKGFFGDLKVDEELRWDTYRQAVRRLREELKACFVPSVVETVQGSKSYYFNGSLPFIILYRVEDEIE